MEVCFSRTHPKVHKTMSSKMISGKNCQNLTLFSYSGSKHCKIKINNHENSPPLTDAKTCVVGLADPGNGM
jgi:hypothetical protein